MTKRKARLTEEERRCLWDKRMYIHRHNGFFGSVKMAERNLIVIINSPSVNSEAKEIAWEIFCALKPLYEKLKDRIDPKEMPKFKGRDSLANKDSQDATSSKA